VEKDSGSLNVPTDASDDDVQQGLSAPAKN
jgi:chemotaxis protein MotB